MKRKLRIVFMGTPDFAVGSLDIIVKSGYDILAVITAPDKPAGRGKKVRTSAVKDYAVDHGLKLMQPVNLKDKDFIDELNALKANLFVIVAFRMLPKLIWAMPEYGSFNLHASLLPDYRGAAPINWAIIKGEEITGVTTFFLNETIDTGDIMYKEQVTIGPDESYGELHDKLKNVGSGLVLKTIMDIENDTVQTISQNELHTDWSNLHLAPKIHKDDTLISWNDSVENIHNLIRGLSPVPAAYTEILSPGGESFFLKIFKSTYEIYQHQLEPGRIETDGRSYLKIAGNNGFIVVREIQLAGKKRMNIIDFLRGFNIDEQWQMQI